MARKPAGLRRYAAYFLCIGFGLFTTLSVLSLVAALLNIPNYGAKLAGQNCACKVPDELTLYVDVGGLTLGLGLLIPTLFFLFSTIYLIISKKFIFRREFKLLSCSGIFLATFIAAALLLGNQHLDENGEAVFESVEPYPLTVRLVNGSIINTDSLIGRTLLVQFFLPSCPLCELQMQELKKIFNRIGEGVLFMLVAPDWSHMGLEDMERFALNVPQGILLGLDVSDATRVYGVDAVPVTVALDAGRSAAFRRIGLAKEYELAEVLSKLSGLRKAIGASAVEESVVVYVEDPLEVPLLQRLAEGFKQRYPNVSVIVLWPACCGPGKVPWVADVITGSDMGLLERLKAQGKLKALAEPLLDFFPAWAKDSEGFWVAQGIKVDVSAYNKALLRSPPSSLLDMTALRDLVVIGRPDHSVKSAPFVALTQRYGTDYWLSYYNSSVMVTPLLRVADILASGGKAATPYIPLSEYVRARTLNEDICYFVPYEGVFIRLSWIAISSNSIHPNAGELWLRYILSKEGQMLRQSIYFDFSPRIDVEGNIRFSEIFKAIQNGNALQPEWSSYSVDAEKYLSFFDNLFSKP